MQMITQRKIGKKKGQALVETALVLPFVILILLGIIDFGILFNNYLIVNNASREGARNAVVGASDSAIFLLVTDITQTLDQSKITLTISPDQSIRKKGDEVTVTVTYRYDFLTPVIGSLMRGPMNLTGRTVMRVE